MPLDVYGRHTVMPDPPEPKPEPEPAPRPGLLDNLVERYLKELPPDDDETSKEKLVYSLASHLDNAIKRTEADRQANLQDRYHQELANVRGNKELINQVRAKYKSLGLDIK